MKFFSASIFVVLLVGVSFGSPALKHRSLSNLLKPDGLLGGVLNTVDHLLGDVLATVHHTVEHISAALHNVLNQLPQVTANVVHAVEDLIHQTGESLVCTVNNVGDGLLTFTAEVAGNLVDVTIDLNTLEICVGGSLIGTLTEDGSILDLEGNVIGLLDAVHGVVIFAGETVHKLLEGAGQLVGGLLGGILETAEGLLHGVGAAVQQAVANISTALLTVLHELPCATADVVNAVQKLISETGQVLVCTVDDLVNGLLTFTGEVSGEGLVVICLDPETLEITLNGEIIGTLAEDGSILDLEGNLCGLVDTVSGVLIYAGTEVHSILDTVHHVVGGLV